MADRAAGANSAERIRDGGMRYQSGTRDSSKQANTMKRVGDTANQLNCTASRTEHSTARPVGHVYEHELKKSGLEPAA